jgi:predicted ArsR family transcriptional regulator
MNDPDPSEDVIEELQEQWKGEEETFDRIFTAILGISKLTWHREIAEIADCSENAAKKHPDRLVNMGLVERKSNPNIALYRRNDAYFE